MFGSKLTGANQREGDGKGAGLSWETGGGGQGPFWLSGAVFSEQVLMTIYFLMALVNFEPNVSHIYTPQLKSWASLLRSTPVKMERIGSSETSAIKAQTPGGYPKKIYGESLKSETPVLRPGNSSLPCQHHNINTGLFISLWNISKTHNKYPTQRIMVVLTLRER